MSLSVAVESVN